MMLGDAFEHVPADSDTRVFRRERRDIKSFRILHEIWRWDGISGKTLIIPLHDTHDYAAPDLIRKLRTAFPISDDYTFTQNEDYCFINYDFDIVL